MHIENESYPLWLIGILIWGLEFGITGVAIATITFVCLLTLNDTALAQAKHRNKVYTHK